jgi:hypothetical protein
MLAMVKKWKYFSHIFNLPPPADKNTNLHLGGQMEDQYQAVASQLKTTFNHIFTSNLSRSQLVVGGGGAKLFKLQWQRTI